MFESNIPQTNDLLNNDNDKVIPTIFDGIDVTYDE